MTLCACVLQKYHRLLEHLLCELAELKSTTPTLSQIRHDCVAAVKLYVELMGVVGVSCAQPKIHDNLHWFWDLDMLGCAEGFSTGTTLACISGKARDGERGHQRGPGVVLTCLFS